MIAAALALLACLFLSPPAAPAAASERPAIAVAASLRIAMPELIAAFEAETGRSVRPAYGASGALTRQIRRGAPFELFMAANTGYPQRLVEARLTEGAGVAYAHGRIGLFAAEGSALQVDAGLQGLAAALEAGRITAFAIPNPRHAPYGVRARQALEHAGLWAAIQPVLVFGENAAQAAQFAASGSATGGIIPASLARAPRFAGRGRFATLPASWHEPLEQRMVLIAGAGETARALYRFLQGERARGILRANGFAAGTTD